MTIAGARSSVGTVAAAAAAATTVLWRGELMADDFKEYTTNDKFTQHFNILFGRTSVFHLRKIKVCQGGYSELRKMLLKYKTDLNFHQGGLVERQTFWYNIYLGNFINEASKGRPP